MKARDFWELVKNPKVGLAVAVAAIGLGTSGCASYQMQQDANGTRVTAQSIDGFGIGAAASGVGNALSGIADIVGAGHGNHHPHPRGGYIILPHRGSSWGPGSAGWESEMRRQRMGHCK